jgi:Gas vesicle synthesis protein GvpL/GvpF
VSLVLYAVAEQSAGETDVLQSRGLRAVAEGGLLAIVGEATLERDQRSEESLWRYERTVERLMNLPAILPARYGSVLSDESAARDSLRTHHERLLPALARVRGASEVGVRAAWRDGDRGSGEDSAARGTAYLLGRLAMYRRAGEITAALAPLRALARAHRERLLPGAGLALLGAYLVDRGRVGEFAERIAALDQGLDDVDLICTGPWPPYTFAGEVT